jgi:hypothetical protein
MINRRVPEKQTLVANYAEFGESAAVFQLKMQIFSLFQRLAALNSPQLAASSWHHDVSGQLVPHTGP